MTVSVDHERLLTLARKAQVAAGDADVEHLRDDLGALVHLLAVHLDRETFMFTRLPPAEVRLLRRGQARVSSAVRALLEDAVAGCPGPPRRCAARAEELAAFISLQARDERLALHASPTTRAMPALWSRS